MESVNLQETSEVYDDNIAEWQYLRAAYGGSKALVDYGVISRHERESLSNHDRREGNAYGFSYSRAIVNLFGYYLFSKPIDRNLGRLADDKQWKMFVKDCDLEGTDYNQFFRDIMPKVISIGQYGILIDKSSYPYTSRASEAEAGVYPYIVSYSSENVLDWEYSRDKDNRPYLSYLKLKDDDGRYHFWWPESWEVWEENDEDDKQTKMIASGTNVLGEIPFVWLYNGKTSVRGVGDSDITDIARIDVSIMRNLSQGEEVIDYSAFPMMRKPYNLGAGGETDEVSVKAILEFDPEMPESKPDWLSAECEEPINALLRWMDRKVQEIYRVANTGGINVSEVQTQARSGISLKLEFRMLNALLVGKANSVRETQLRIMYFWLKWQNLEEFFPEITLKAPENFDVESLVQDLENALVARTIVRSEVFDKALQKRVTRQMLPEISDEQLSEIDQDIEKNPGGLDLSYNPPEPDVKKETDEGDEK